MKRLIIASIGGLALGLAAADAADLSVPYKAVSPAPYVWTGCYLGGHAGTLWSQSNWRVNDPADPFYGQTDGSHIVNGWLSGVQAVSRRGTASGSACCLDQKIVYQTARCP